ncbi:MAG: hypothetical protein JW864_07080 [Spirochaetes bacterium]|nr:hypothetical protein [Spirochaetota bacterium]
MVPANTKELTAEIKRYLSKFPGDLICARQIWYEGLGGQGTPNPTEMDAMHAVLDSLKDWTSVGNVRYEKFGQQHSFKRIK